MYTLIDRKGLELLLRDFAAGALPEPQFRTFLRTAVVGDEFDVPEQDEDLVASTVNWMEAADESLASLRAAAGEAQSLLGAGLANHDTVALLVVARARRRLLEMMDKVNAGQLSRTAFVSFVTDQGWPASLKQRMLALGTPALAALAEALGQQDYAAASHLLL